MWCHAECVCVCESFVGARFNPGHAFCKNRQACPLQCCLSGYSHGMHANVPQTGTQILYCPLTQLELVELKRQDLNR